MRFGDYMAGTWVILLGGTDVAEHATEAVPALDGEGTVCMYSKPLHRCYRCMRGVCEYVASGDVAVVLREGRDVEAQGLPRLPRRHEGR